MIPTECRPPTLMVDDDAPIRHDIDNDDVRRTYPRLATSYRARAARQRAFEARDRRAYEEIRHVYPNFCPAICKEARRSRRDR